MDLDSAAIVLAARELLPASDVDLSDALVKLEGPQGLLSPGNQRKNARRDNRYQASENRDGHHSQKTSISQ